MLFTFVLDTSVFQEAIASTRHPALQVQVVVMVVLVMGIVMVAMAMATVTRANNGDIEVLLHEKKLFAMIAGNIGSQASTLHNYGENQDHVQQHHYCEAEPRFNMDSDVLRVRGNEMDKHHQQKQVFSKLDC